jgi:putative nucleotidyltransferase with HDIG domain
VARTPLADRLKPNLTLVGWFVAPLAALVLLLHVPTLDVSHSSVHNHLLIVSAIASCALAAAVATAIAALRLRRPGPVFLALGCLIAGSLMLVHGLVTPDGHRPMNMWIGRAPVLAILGFTSCQGAAALASGSRVARFLGRRAIVLFASVTTALATLAIVVVAKPTALHGASPIRYEHGLARIACAIAVLILIPTAAVHWRRYRLGCDRLQAVLALAAALNVAAVFSLQYGVLWHVSWWSYHVYLLAAFSSVAFTIFRRYRSAATVANVLDSAFAVDPLEHIATNYPDALRALVNAVEVKDAYTHGHSRRTAEVATALGARMGLPPEQLRVLAKGAYLHDVGKIGIPDAVLNKPGRLSSEEREIIETHAALGAEIVAQAPSLHDCVDIVRHHHERVDGDGYPDRMFGERIPLLARITAVADVWDALTSDRAYRPGWKPERALAHIVAGGGSHFDARVVTHFVELAREWGYTVGAEVGDGDEASRAAFECHEVGESRIPVLNRP